MEFTKDQTNILNIFLDKMAARIQICGLSASPKAGQTVDLGPTGKMELVTGVYDARLGEFVGLVQDSEFRRQSPDKKIEDHEMPERNR